MESDPEPEPRTARRLFSAGGWRAAVPTIAAVVAVTAFVTAGNWQRDRMQQKQAAASQFDAASAAPVEALPAGVTDWAPWRYRRVEIEGRYDAGGQILLDNRVHAGRFGYHVVTPLRLADGRTVLVNRGWVSGGATRDALPSVPPPAGDSRVRGRVQLPPVRNIELATTEPDRGVWQVLDPARFARATGIGVLPIVIEQLEGPADGLARDWPAPDLGSAKHIGYMLQWYAFAAIVAALWAYFTFRRRPAS